MRQQTSALTHQAGWEAIASWTAAITTPAVAARSYEDVKAVTTILEAPPHINAIQLRVTGTTNNHSEVFDILIARDVDDTFTRIATATCTIGQQQKADNTTLLADTIVLSNNTWLGSKIEARSGADDYQADLWIDLMGHQYVAIVPTTVNGTTTVEWSGC